MKPAPERIWLGKPLDDKSWEWHGAWSPKPFSENVNSVEYVRADIADARSAALSSKLGQLTILLLQEAYVEARELALQITVEFPDGSPVATLEEVT